MTTTLTSTIEGVDLVTQKDKKELEQNLALVDTKNNKQSTPLQTFTNNIKINDRTYDISKHEHALQSLFADQTIKLYWTVNQNLELGINIVSQQVYNYISQFRKPPFNIEIGASHYTVHINAGRISQLIDELKQNKNLVDLASAIRSFESSSTWEKHPRRQEILYKFDSFFNDVPIEAKRNKQPYSTLIKSVTDFANELAKGPMSLEEVQSFADNLDNELAEKEPMQMNTKLIIAGLIGAVVGLIAGVAIGAALTWYAGGFGAIPGMFIGMSQGFTIATGITTVTGASAGLIPGYFSAEWDKNTHTGAKLLKNSFFSVPKIYARELTEDSSSTPAQSLSPNLSPKG